MSSRSTKHAISPTRAENYAGWYQQCVKGANLAENSEVRGCMILKPLGYSLWERIRMHLDQTFKALGVQNVYMPLFVPVKSLEKEAHQISGFAKECAVVTHHRLIEQEGKLVPDPESKLEELLVVRPTSELLFGEAMSRWVRSYRDLPLLLNQWANVVRWEMRTRPFLRTTEFLWQEGHTAHATAEEANAFAKKMLFVYRDFCRDLLAMDVVSGEKSESEKFPGAKVTYTNEAMMQDKKALQACTSHDLGQNFAKACQIRFSTQGETLEEAHTTSWGLTTRMIGALLMSHGDDDGAVFPPAIAPYQVGIIPFLGKEGDREIILPYIDRFVALLSHCQFRKEPIRILWNAKSEGGSALGWQYRREGVCHLVEIGKREAEEERITLRVRDSLLEPKRSLSLKEYLETVAKELEDLQMRLHQRQIAFRKEHSRHVQSKQELFELLSGGVDAFFYLPFSGDPQAEEELKEKFGVTVRCYPFEEREEGPCLFTGKRSKVAILARSY